MSQFQEFVQKSARFMDKVKDTTIFQRYTDHRVAQELALACQETRANLNCYIDAMRHGAKDIDWGLWEKEVELARLLHCNGFIEKHEFDYFQRNYDEWSLKMGREVEF